MLEELSGVTKCTIHSMVVGWKNWLFADTSDGAEANASG